MLLSTDHAGSPAHGYANEDICNVALGQSRGTNLRYGANLAATYTTAERGLSYTLAPLAEHLAQSIGAGSASRHGLYRNVNVVKALLRPSWAYRGKSPLAHLPPYFVNDGAWHG